ncbi:ankyrin repeat domain-containing protein [Capsaspora owczarzaki ATCC 30864]|uniref:Ankyrin repeat domain-containing protein n=1 Tax=Capsaspora owczarzaki (strain ATCC 30864) TaxID=595528 RepID=A0A0D2VYV2_CAPO3|nr:ankyrin repeat domain-containing protein [Capsaspora owczarzaki ATCC 30864]KJE96937.1 ankyrin repeat domain-containing protein [Capsaspora owczarzaki ATCC 30864]|eukprot:XP_004343905.2 ankyrin repeat domain-containing protein [Capsaspora owczarzaki ATCC 30864]
MAANASSLSSASYLSLYPLHVAVWRDAVDRLRELLDAHREERAAGWTSITHRDTGDDAANADAEAAANSANADTGLLVDLGPASDASDVSVTPDTHDPAAAAAAAAASSVAAGASQRTTHSNAEDSEDPWLNAKDPHGRTALLLAITLDRAECVKLLLNANADATGKSPLGFAYVKEAISTADRALLRDVCVARKHQMAHKLRARVPQLLRLLETTGDFYVEMNWEFTSWVPLLSRMCPSDTYRIWKRGACVRLDTSLVGFEDMKWIRGNLSFIFRATGEAGSMTGILFQINHDEQRVIYDEVQAGECDIAGAPSVDEDDFDDDVLDALLSAPITSTDMGDDKIAFSRMKSGLWGFQSEKTDMIGDYEAKAYALSGVEVRTRHRTEHLPVELRDKAKQQGTFSSLMKLTSAQKEEDLEQLGRDSELGERSLTPVGPVPKPAISEELYFSGKVTSSTTHDFTSEVVDHHHAAAEHGDDHDDGDDSELINVEPESKSGASSLLSIAGWRSGAKKLLHNVSSAASTAYASVSAAAHNTSASSGSPADYQSLGRESAASAPSGSGAAASCHIGRPLVMSEQVQKFKGTVWMSEAFPLSLQRQVLPIIDLMSPNNAHFAKLRDFIDISLPSGFPVKIELPLFRVISARVTFANCSDGPVLPELFEVPAGYDQQLADGFSGTIEVSLPSAVSGAKRADRRRRAARRGMNGNAFDDEMMLQMALRESLTDARRDGAQAEADGVLSDEEIELQEALMASMMMSTGASQEDIDAAIASYKQDQEQRRQEAIAARSRPVPSQASAEQQVAPSPSDSDLALALQLSQQQALEDEQARNRREEEELEMVLRMSLEQQ